MFQTINSVGSNTLSLKYQLFEQLRWKDIEIWNFEFVVKTQFLYLYVYIENILFVIFN